MPLIRKNKFNVGGVIAAKAKRRVGGRENCWGVAAVLALATLRVEIRHEPVSRKGAGSGLFLVAVFAYINSFHVEDFQPGERIHDAQDENS